MATATNTGPAAISWHGDHAGYLRLLDQTLLPGEIKHVDCQTVEVVWEAIKMLRVRGAPAIGIAAAYGVVLAAQQGRAAALEAVKYLATSRPTAVNLFWALDRMEAAIGAVEDESQLVSKLLAVASEIHQDDRDMCHAIGKHGATLIANGSTLLTHCNAGGLATAEYGTALSVMFTCQDQGKEIQVFADETRPLLQGSRLTAWELRQRGIPVTVICDSMAAHVMQTRKIDAVIVGADRIAANGDAANKIGTYGLGVLAKYHQVPFYVAAPSSTFDLSLNSGKLIPIEERKSDEVVKPFGHSIAPDGVNVYNPAFDVTPAELITAIITEKGVIENPSSDSVAKLMGNA